MAYDYKFTVFTPTFNRAATLHRVYESLGLQTFRDFEWLIVDDGSTDETARLVERWQLEASFPIRYLHQENGGKHVAFNRGVANARGELFLSLDSDDACAPESLERLLYWWETIPEEEREGFSAVVTNVADQHGKLNGVPFPRSPLDGNSVEMMMRYKVRGEKWGFQRTDVLRAHPFPEPEGVRHVSPGVIWREIDMHYKSRFVNEVLRTWWVDEVGKANLTKLSASVLEGRAMHHRQTLNDLLSWFRFNPLEFVKAATNLARYDLLQGKSPGSIVSSVRSPLAKSLVTAMLPIGAALSLRDRRRIEHRSSGS